MRFAIILAVLLAKVKDGQSDDWKMNRCHKDFLGSNVPGFSADKILGRWYLKRETKGGPDCTSIYFGRNTKGELRFSEVSFEVGDEIKLSNPATLKFSNNNDGSFVIHMEYDSQSSLDGAMRIMGTDFDNYLVLYTCKNMGIFYYESFLVLFRQWNDNSEFDLQIAQSMILASDDQKKKIKPTKHENCKDPLEDDLFFVKDEFKFVKVEQPKTSEEDRKKQMGEKEHVPLPPDEKVNQFFRGGYGGFGNETEFYDF